MATKIYISGGAINIDDGVNALVIINPFQFDWKPSALISPIYSVRDKIDNQSYDLGLLANVQDIDGNVFASDLLLQSYLSTLVNNTGSNSTDVNIQDQTTPAVEHYLFKELADVVITGTPTKGTNVLTLEAGHGFLAPVAPNKDYLNIHYVDTAIPGFVGTRFGQFAVVAVNVNDISITPPLPYDLDPAKVEFSKRVDVNMAIDGTFIAPEKFITYPPNGQKWDLTRMIPNYILSSLADDGLFGNIAALTNGIFFGFEGDNYTEYQLAIFDNGDWRASAFDVEPTVRSGGGGDFGLAIRKSSAGQDKLGVAIRLDGSTNDKFVKYVQDLLSTLGRYRVKIMGHIVED